MGADEFVDYTAGDFAEKVKDVDVVSDTVGGDTLERAFRTLKKGGYLVTSVAPPSAATANSYGVAAKMVLVEPSAKQLGEINQLIAAKKLKPHVETVLPLAEVEVAVELSKGGRTRGKIVLRPRG